MDGPLVEQPKHKLKGRFSLRVCEPSSIACRPKINQAHDMSASMMKPVLRESSDETDNSHGFAFRLGLRRPDTQKNPKP